jgi:hypothetical protein
VQRMTSGTIRYEDHLNLLLSQDSDPYLISIQEEVQEINRILSPKSTSRKDISTEGISRNVSFGAKIMQSVIKNEDLTFRESKLRDMQYAEVFDRSGRTYAATFAKFGDLSYFTPVQRIGCYMDHTARLKKKHILDLIAYLKQAHK